MAEIDMDDCSERLAAHHVAALICSAHGLSIKQWVSGRPAEQYDGILLILTAAHVSTVYCPSRDFLASAK